MSPDKRWNGQGKRNPEFVAEHRHAMPCVFIVSSVFGVIRVTKSLSGMLRITKVGRFIRKWRFLMRMAVMIMRIHGEFPRWCEVQVPAIATRAIPHTRSVFSVTLMSALLSNHPLLSRRSVSQLLFVHLLVSFSRSDCGIFSFQPDSNKKTFTGYDVKYGRLIPTGIMSRNTPSSDASVGWGN